MERNILNNIRPCKLLDSWWKQILHYENGSQANEEELSPALYTWLNVHDMWSHKIWDIQ